WQPAEDRSGLTGLLLLARLDLFPLFEDLAGRVDPGPLSEHVRMPPDQLRADGPERVGDPEASLVGRDLREEHPFEQEVADLSLERVVIVRIDRVQDLVGLLEDERP